MQTRVMRGRRADADETGTRRQSSGPDRLRDLARIAGDLGAEELVHDAIAFAERSDLTPEMIDAAVERYADRLIFELDERRAALMRPPALTGSHSAALGLVILSYAAERGLGFSSFVSAGNRADVSGNDLLQFWEEDSSTDIAVRTGMLPAGGAAAAAGA